MGEEFRNLVQTVEENLNSKFATVPDPQQEKRQRILESLYFKDMHARQEEVHDAYEETFKWVFDQNSRDNMAWDSLTKWLERENGIYWINGKAGSGKSTVCQFDSILAKLIPDLLPRKPLRVPPNLRTVRGRRGSWVFPT